MGPPAVFDTKDVDEKGVAKAGAVPKNSDAIEEWADLDDKALGNIRLRLNSNIHQLFKDTESAALLWAEIKEKSLGAEGVIPSRQIEGFLRDFKQFTHNIPSGKIVGFLEICPSI